MKDKSEKIKVQGATRSKGWRKFRNNFLKKFPACAMCGGKKKLQAHHILPYHLYPEKELLESNLITLCENGNKQIDCHLYAGHLGNFKSYNVDIRADSAIWLKKRLNRPK